MISNTSDNMDETGQKKIIPGNHEIIKYLSKYVTLSDAEALSILKNLDIRTYDKGDILLKEGQTADLCYFVIKGCIRQYYLVNGEERTTDFFTEGQPVSAFKGTYIKKPSPYFLSCLEPCTLSVGAIADEEKEYNPKLGPVCKLAAEDDLTKAQETLSWYRLTNAEERYLELLKTRPDLIDRVPQYYLASYLGIKPESLSRIRKRIIRKA